MLHLVWVRGLRGPMAEIQNDEFKPMGKPRPFLVKYQLTLEDEGLSLDVLKRIYPGPKMTPEPKIKLPDDDPPPTPPGNAAALAIPKTGTDQ